MPRGNSRRTSGFVPSGIIVPMITPFKGKDMREVDHNALGSLTNYLIENGVSGLMVNGTSGEFSMQSHDERKAALRTVLEATSRRVPVIAGVSESSTKNALDLATDAEQAGATAIISTGPIYYKTDCSGLTYHFQKLLDETNLPLMIYNIPSWIGYNIPPSIVFDLVENNRGRIAGVKFTTNDLGLFLEYLRLLKGRTSVMIGSDSLIFSALELGANGAVVGSANVLPSETAKIYRDFKSGKKENARLLQERIDPFTEAMVLGTYPAALKEGLKYLGYEVGEVRPPLTPLSRADSAKVRSSLAWKRMKR
ncbi:MAG: dihydrodipicolinate synthase family protein [Thaumarchaeota archaeon]|nr:dihydrodipicolinate synthase family protein [Nitrososphaerota archaeon]